MKAIGARSGRIGRLYLAMTFVVSMAATLLALGPALLLGRLGADRLPAVRAAIDHHGLSASSNAATGLLARLSRMRRLNREIVLALRNTVRRPARFLLSVVS